MTKQMHRRGVGRASMALLLQACIFSGTASAAEDVASYPSKPIRLIIPTPPGGTMDAMARLLGEKLGEAWKQPVVVDNRAGANGAIAYGAVAKAAPDGYTVLLSISSLVQTLLLSRNPTYSLQELAPVSLVAMLPNGFAVGKDVPAATLPQFLDWARKQPQGVDYGSSGAGSSGNIMGGTLAQASGVRMLHVPYKGEAPAIQAVVGGQMQAVFGSMGSLAVQAKAGSLKMLAVALPQRLADFPAVPTFAEAGFTDVNLPGWAMALVPAGTPKPIVDKLAVELTRVLRLPDVKARIFSFGFVPEGGDAATARKFVDDEMRRWDKAIKAANITQE